MQTQNNANVVNAFISSFGFSKALLLNGDEQPFLFIQSYLYLSLELGTIKPW